MSNAAAIVGALQESLKAGKSILIVGEAGSGKSTLARAITKELPATALGTADFDNLAFLRTAMLYETQVPLAAVLEFLVHTNQQEHVVLVETHKNYTPLIHWRNGQQAQTTSSNVTEVLKQRGGKYGLFKNQAALTQRLEGMLLEHNATHGQPLSTDKCEAIHMILHKLARIANGDPEYADSWVDIAGYAQLVVNNLEGVEK